jgi:hypothetical protein
LQIRATYIITSTQSSQCQHRYILARKPRSICRIAEDEGLSRAGWDSFGLLPDGEAGRVRKTHDELPPKHLLGWGRPPERWRERYCGLVVVVVVLELDWAGIVVVVLEAGGVVVVVVESVVDF